MGYKVNHAIFPKSIRLCDTALIHHLTSDVPEEMSGTKEFVWQNLFSLCLVTS